MMRLKWQWHRPDIRVGDDVMLRPGMRLDIDDKTFEVIAGQCKVRLIHVEREQVDGPHDPHQSD
jgi:hypothetical protein